MPTRTPRTRGPRCGATGLVDVAQATQVVQRLQPRQEEVRPSPNGGERRYPGDAPPYRPLRDLELQCPVLCADDRIALVAELVEVLVVDPHVLRELELPNQARADHERR